MAARLEGWLEVEEGKTLRKKVKKKWFVVKDNKMFWYKAIQDVKYAGFIDLFRCSNVFPLNERHFNFKSGERDKIWGFQLNSSEKNYCFVTSSEEEMKFWVDGLNNHLREKVPSRSFYSAMSPTLSRKTSQYLSNSESLPPTLAEEVAQMITNRSHSPAQERSLSNSGQGAVSSGGSNSGSTPDVAHRPQFSLSSLVEQAKEVLNNHLINPPAFYPGEKVIWKMPDVKLHTYDEEGMEMTQVGTTVITNYKLLFNPDDMSDSIELPLLQVLELESDIETLEIVNSAKARDWKKIAKVQLTKLVKTGNDEEDLINGIKDKNAPEKISKRNIELRSKDFRTFRFSFPSQNLASSKEFNEGNTDEEFEGKMREAFPVSLYGIFTFAMKKEIERTKEKILKEIKSKFEQENELDETECDLLKQIETNLLTDNTNEGWNVYKPSEEHKRIGVPCERWRVTELNKDYRLCNTYPKDLVVPSTVTDPVLAKVFSFRSMGRIPALTWKHPNSNAVIVRCSQPRVGLTSVRCEEDELLCSAITYGTSGTLYVMDARPKVNAMANQAKGSGYEKMTSYKNAKIKFLGIENIHVVRSSLNKLQSICSSGHSKSSENSNWLSDLESTHWLGHIKAIVKGARRIAQLVEYGNTVLIHCSDGWDRTSQLSALAQLLLDPYYRTIRGFQVLIEKDWLHFGHKFADRCGHLNYQVEKEQSPIFLQFMDAVFQICRQFPSAFEFNTHFLVTIMDHVTSGLFGTFLCNSLYERIMAKVSEDTVSLWSYINKNHKPFKNHRYESPFPVSLDSLEVMPHISLVLYPSVSEPHIVLWEEYFFRDNKQLLRPFTQITLAEDHIADLLDNHESIGKELRMLIASQKSVSIEELQQIYTKCYGGDLLNTSRAPNYGRTITASRMSRQMPTLDSDEEDDTDTQSEEYSQNPYQSHMSHFITMEELKLEGIVREGFLNKKGGKRHNWTTRWFVCTKSSLCYFKRSTDAKPRGQILLYGSKIGTSARKAFCFAIKCPERTYLISASSEEMKEAWIRTLQEETSLGVKSNQNTLRNMKQTESPKRVKSQEDTMTPGSNDDQTNSTTSSVLS